MDRAGIDFRQWYKWKENSIYFLSREKENMNLQVLGVHPFDCAAPINRGVIADELVGTSVGAARSHRRWWRPFHLQCLLG